MFFFPNIQCKCINWDGTASRPSLVLSRPINLKKWGYIDIICRKQQSVGS